jgi:hypothetical protein
VVPVLKDHGLQNVAQVLDALLFEYDTIEGEIYKLIMSDPVKILGLLLGKKSGKE